MRASLFVVCWLVAGGFTAVTAWLWARATPAAWRGDVADYLSLVFVAVCPLLVMSLAVQPEWPWWQWVRACGPKHRRLAVRVPPARALRG